MTLVMLDDLLNVTNATSNDMPVELILTIYGHEAHIMTCRDDVFIKSSDELLNMLVVSFIPTFIDDHLGLKIWLSS